MDEARRKQLEAAGYKVTDTQEFLGLSDEEMAYIDLRIAVRKALRARREAEGLTQKALATRLGSSQSRIAKMESGRPVRFAGPAHSRIAGDRSHGARHCGGHRTGACASGVDSTRLQKRRLDRIDT